MGNVRLNKPVTGMVPFGNGYLMVGEDGGIFNFSDSEFLGSLGANPPEATDRGRRRLRLTRPGVRRP